LSLKKQFTRIFITYGKYCWGFYGTRILEHPSIARSIAHYWRSGHTLLALARWLSALHSFLCLRSSNATSAALLAWQIK